MIEVKSIGAPLRGAHWSMGAKHMQRINRPDAAKLCAPYAAPAIGYERDVSVKPDASFRRVLTVQNIAGHFYLASCTDVVTDWPALFDVTVSGYRDA
jgi:hypothetical protein